MEIAITLSVIIPTYNGEQFLAEALESICQQSDVSDIECVVVDDGSTDSTLSIIGKFLDKLTLVVVKKTGEKGWVSSTNLALQHARGVYSCFLHQDDIWLPNRLAVLRTLIKTYPLIDCFITSAQFVSANGRVLGNWTPKFNSLPRGLSTQDVLEVLLIQNVIAIPAPLFRTRTALDVGGLDESLWYTADWDFWLKLVSVGTAGYFPDKTVGFRIHQQAQTVKRSDNAGDFSLQMESVLLRHAEDVSVNDVYRRAANFSIRVNVVLASVLHGNWRIAYPFLWNGFWLDWKMLHTYWQNSCIAQRVMARVRGQVYAWRCSVRNRVRGD